MLTLARPDKHNAMSGQMIAELAGAAELLANDDKVRAVVLTGDGDSFCAGADLAWMRAQASAPREERIAEARKLALALRALNQLPKPLIGRINGQAFGGGLGLMSVCDVTVVVDTARFGFTEVRLGLIPATISPYVLARMGEGYARRVFMSARVFDANEARELGLVSRAVPPADLDSAIEAEVRPYRSASPQAVAAAKALARRLGPAIDDAIICETVALLADTWETTDAFEGIAAFFDHRRPHWQA
ncbi:crotonase/enoyl-CoA hydratase family protein [Mesorhizobium sp. M0130]|uniref:crotonase/enoyl-CoA hydratase family protein n=1 Tax=Mesorhizobium sp. M0130 TaxID=2956887 RepID=UPI0033363233